MESVRTRRLLQSAGVLIPLVLLGCEGTDRGDWTLKRGILTLTETLHRAEGESYFFGAIYDIAVGRKGRIYVADGKMGHVKVLSRRGKLDTTIGRSGEGPGEFRRPVNLGFTRQDSVYVMDGERLSVFGPPPTHSFQYSFRPTGKESSGAPRNMMVKKNGGGALFAFLPFPKTITKADVMATVRPVGSNGTVGDVLFTARPRQTTPERNIFPFSRRSAFALGPSGSVHHAWSGDLRVVRYDQSGVRTDTIEVPFDPVSISPQERDSLLRDLSKERRRDLRGQIPATKPAFTQFLIDDKGRYWFGRPTSNSSVTEWWLVWPNEQRVETTTLPSKVDLEVVQNEQAYGTTTTESGAPALVRYQIQRES